MANKYSILKSNSTISLALALGLDRFETTLQPSIAGNHGVARQLIGLWTMLGVALVRARELELGDVQAMMAAVVLDDREHDLGGRVARGVSAQPAK